MRARDYELVAQIINGLPDDVRLSVADHFAKRFHATNVAFDVMAWEQRTGGKLKRTVQETYEERRARVMGYASKVLGREVV